MADDDYVDHEGTARELPSVSELMAERYGSARALEAERRAVRAAAREAERYGSAGELEAERRTVRAAGLREPEPEPEPEGTGEGRAARLAASWWRLAAEPEPPE